MAWRIIYHIYPDAILILEVFKTLRAQSSGPNSELFSKDLKYGVPRLSIFKTYRNRNITFDSKIEKNGNVRLKELNVPYIDIVSSLKQFDKGEDTMEANLNGFFSMKSKSQSLSLKPSSTLKGDSKKNQLNVRLGLVL